MRYGQCFVLTGYVLLQNTPATLPCSSLAPRPDSTGVAYWLARTRERKVHCSCLPPQLWSITWSILTYTRAFQRAPQQDCRQGVW